MGSIFSKKPNSKSSNLPDRNFVIMHGVIIWMIAFFIVFVFLIFKQKLLGYNSVNQEVPDGQEQGQSSGQINLTDIDVESEKIQKQTK